MSARELPRYWSKVDKSEGGCWNWTAARTPAGYGVFRLPNGGGLDYAHRIAVEAPEGAVVDHLCRNRACVNPEHLDLVTTAINGQRGALAAKGLPHISTGDLSLQAAELYRQGGYTQRQVAAMFNVNQASVSRALRRSAA